MASYIDSRNYFNTLNNNIGTMKIKQFYLTYILYMPTQTLQNYKKKNILCNILKPSIVSQ